jgi:hypothetical protein
MTETEPTAAVADRLVGELIDRDRDDALQPWVARAGRLIADRLADARAHAQAGRTFEANERIAELRRELLDVDTSAGGSLLSNARAEFYRQGFRAEPFDPAIHRPLYPDPAGELAARYSLIGGRNQYLDARILIEDITGSLRGLGHTAAILGDSPPAGGPEYWPAQYDGWQKRQTERLTGHVRSTLSDAQMALYHAVGRLRIKPELL